LAGTSAGIDVVSIERIGRASEKKLFLDRVFTPFEVGYAEGMARPEKHLAGRFAAKEAFVKALSIGILSGVSLREIEVVNGQDGRPSLRLGPGAAALVAGRHVHLSISYTKNHAFALVVIGDKG